MYVCICNGVTDSDIHRALDSGARNFRQVSERLGVSSQCGSCEAEARAVIAEYRQMGVPDCSFYAAV